MTARPPCSSPPAFREWVPENDLAHLVIDAVASWSLDQYRFQILLRARQSRHITEPLMAALASLKIPREVIVTVDVDPVNLG